MIRFFGKIYGILKASKKTYNKMGATDMNEYKPTLTFDLDETDNQNIKPVNEQAKELVQEAEKFSPEEQQQIDEFARQIDLTNSSMILNYGVSAQKKSVQFSEKALKSVSTKSFGEIGQLLSQMTVEIGSLNKEEKHGLSGFFQKKKNKMAALKANYANAESNIDKITDQLQNHQYTLLKDISMLDSLYDQNKVYYKEISMYIAAGRKCLDEAMNKTLPELQKKAEVSNDQADIEAVHDLSQMISRFEKKLHDLELTRTVALQTAPQIRLVQTDDAVMAEKIQSTIVNTIPLWKNQMVLALNVEHASQAAQAEKLVTDMTNQMLKSNADKLKQTTVMAAEANERSIVDIETLKYTNESLISTLDEVMRISEEGKQHRQAAESELAHIEQELKDKLLEASSQVRGNKK